MKNIKLSGMKALINELNAWEGNHGWHVQVTLDRETGKIWGVPHTANSYNIYDEPACVSNFAATWSEDEYGYPVSHSQRNAAIREWARRNIAQYNA